MGLRVNWTYETVRGYFEKAGCTLLSTSYRRKKDKLLYICECGTKSEISFDKFSQGRRCGCRIKSFAKTRAHSYEYVKDFFKSKGCELLSDEYLNTKEKLYYKCTCGKPAWISFSKFQAGQRCYSCKLKFLSESQKGEKGNNYKPHLTTADRIKERNYPEYKQWRKDVMKRDDYTCQVCSIKGGRLNAHHIESYADNPDKRTDINNGITLCESCHSEYHKAFGINGANVTDFESFMFGEYNNNLREPQFDESKEEEYEDTRN
jgi:5-methylcytosine-specific restriction endonuclease McrA